ncbi:MAG: GNAT family N-acetyltransferase [Pseudomonadota bacterium]
MAVTAKRHTASAEAIPSSSNETCDAAPDTARAVTVASVVSSRPFTLSDGTRLTVRIAETLDADGRETILALRDTACRTLFNSPEWIEAWLSRGDLNHNGTPVFLSASNAAGQPALFLPLFLRLTGGARVLTWIGEETFAVQNPLCSDEIRSVLTPDDIKRMFLALREMIDGGFDAVRLRNQPGSWAGAQNPFAASAAHEAPNANYERELHADFTALYNDTFTSRERRNHARQHRRLLEFGSVEMSVAATDAEREEILAAFFSFKTAQLDQIGAANPFASTEMRQFYRRALQSVTQANAMTPIYAGLRVDGKLVATLVGVRDNDRFTTLMSAITLDEIARTSPGQHLLEHVIAQLCSDDVRVFDFGPGASPQKLRWNMRPVTLYSVALVFHPRAWPVIFWGRTTSSVMRRLKSNTRLFRALSLIRARIAGRTHSNT